MDNSPNPVEEPANLRFLRLLVTTLTGVMIVGLLTIIGLFVMRFSGGQTTLPLPEVLALPDGVTPEAVTYTAEHILVVNGTDLLVFSTDGALLQTVELVSSSTEVAE